MDPLCIVTLRPGKQLETDRTPTSTINHDWDLIGKRTNSGKYSFWFSPLLVNLANTVLGRKNIPTAGRNFFFLGAKVQQIATVHNVLVFWARVPSAHSSSAGLAPLQGPFWSNSFLRNLSAWPMESPNSSSSALLISQIDSISRWCFFTKSSSILLSKLSSTSQLRSSSSSLMIMPKTCFSAKSTAWWQKYQSTVAPAMAPIACPATGINLPKASRPWGPW